jgi:hypothetical protein
VVYSAVNTSVLEKQEEKNNTAFLEVVYRNAQGGGGGMGTAILDGVQTGLDVVGLIPGVGEIADGVNALIYTGRGDYVNAGLSAAAMIPFAGWAATGTKLGKKATGLTYDLINRTSKGADGGMSRHVIERLDGDVISRTHQVFKDGSIIHQHQNHIGKYGTVRTFPEEWLMFPTIK